MISDIYPDHKKEVRPACMALSSEMLLLQSENLSPNAKINKNKEINKEDYV